ncbi:MAG: ABC transporter ATP-binding protein [Candidatus Bathyarchaeia archaeon]
MGGEVYLKVDSINCFYGDALALQDVSLSVGENEVVAIVGSNGSGKTTLIKAIMGYLKPRKGAIWFLGERIDGLKPYEIAKKGIGAVLEGRALFPRMTVLENLEMGAYKTEAWKRRKENLEFIYKLFPILKERRNQLAGTLSGGEQQMLAIARALMSNPKLLLLDEPSAGLAPLIVKKLYERLLEIKQYGTSILIVEQNVYVSLRVAERAYVLERGKIIAEGTGKELLESDLIRKAYLYL